MKRGSILYPSFLPTSFLSLLLLLKTNYCIAAKEFTILEFAMDGEESSDVNYGVLKKHQPSTPFPDTFTICWRSQTMFQRNFWSGDYIEIPYKPGERFLALYQENNATHSMLDGKEINRYQLIGT